MEKLAADWGTLSDALAQLISDAGGKVVGRTRLQKMACLLKLTGFDDGFTFQYKHFGPYSDLLYSVSKFAAADHKIEEEEKPTSWGGWYSTYSTIRPGSGDASRVALCRKIVDANLIDLELAVTAAFLATEGIADPWEETAARKTNKATPERLAGARVLYAELRAMPGLPMELPAI